MKDGITVRQASLGFGSVMVHAWSQDLESGFRAAPFRAPQPAELSPSVELHHSPTQLSLDLTSSLLLQTGGVFLLYSPE